MITEANAYWLAGLYKRGPEAVRGLWPSLGGATAYRDLAPSQLLQDLELTRHVHGRLLVVKGPVRGKKWSTCFNVGGRDLGLFEGRVEGGGSLSGPD